MEANSFNVTDAVDSFKAPRDALPQRRLSDITGPAYDSIIESGILIVDLRGLVDLRLYGFIRRAIDARQSEIQRILFCFHEENRIADSGYASLVALDRYTRGLGIFSFIIGTNGEVERFVRARCRWITVLE
jgi:hypothetical protein